jgi:hypothetical protein
VVLDDLSNVLGIAIEIQEKLRDGLNFLRQLAEPD